MKIIRGDHLQFVPASHEDPQNPGVLKKVLFSQKDLAAGKIKMINWAKLPEKKKFKPHYHEDMEEIFIIIKGEVKIKIRGKENILKTGDSVLIPIKAVHVMENVGRSDAHYIVIGNSKGHSGKTVNPE